MDRVFSSQQLFDGAAGSAAEFAGGGFGVAQIGIYDGGKTDRFAFASELMVDARVVAPEDAYADDSNVDAATGCQRVPALSSAAQSVPHDKAHAGPRR